MTARICIVGEGMIELSRGDAGWQLGYGGDTVNTAVHLARYGYNVAYLSALGTDPLSAQLRRDWEGEGVDTHAVLSAEDRLPGLYVIHTDATGERSFNYWRSEAAARHMFALPDSAVLDTAADGADLLYYSLITLAILPEAGRERLFDIVDRVRAKGGLVAFDGNYRPRLWSSREAAQAARDQAIARCDIGLPTLADEVAMGEADDPNEAADRWGRGGAEVVIKLGAEGCLIDGAIIPPPACVHVVDTSGAGDSFNAGYLSARLAGADQRSAALAGHRLAGWTIARRGAIPARDGDAPYLPVA